MMRGMTDPGMMRRMRGRGMSGPMMRIIFALIDTDGDGTISLQEWQAAHERIFKSMDANKDGTVTLDEMRNFMAGRTGSAPQQ
jgi:Ca2+-binding EF-hand superfamily protein